MSVNVHNGTAASFSVWDLKNAKSTKVGFSAMGNLATEHSPQGKLQHMTEVGTVYSFQPDVHAHQVVSGGDCLHLSLLPCMQPPLRLLLHLRGGGSVPRTCKDSPKALARKARQLAIRQRDQRARQRVCASSYSFAFEVALNDNTKFFHNLHIEHYLQIIYKFHLYCFPLINTLVWANVLHYS